MRFPAFLRVFFMHRFSKPALAVVAFAAAYILAISLPNKTGVYNVAGFEKTLHQKEKALSDEVDSLMTLANGRSYAEIFKTRPARYNSLFREKGFVLLIYQGDTLKYWSAKRKVMAARSSG
jgi:hypothetical protein